MQEVTIKETQTVLGGQVGHYVASGALLSIGPLGYLLGWAASGNPDPSQWKLC